MTLDLILEKLNRFHQRATYGAVAGALSVPQRSLMRDCPKNPMHSWIVAKGNGEPTGYSPRQKHEALYERDYVLDTESALIAWLRDPR